MMVVMTLVRMIVMNVQSDGLRRFGDGMLMPNLGWRDGQERIPGDPRRKADRSNAPTRQ